MIVYNIINVGVLLISISLIAYTLYIYMGNTEAFNIYLYHDFSTTCSETL